MLTLKLITEETDRVISGLEKKHFTGAKEAIDNVLAVDKRRREAQQKLDKTKQEAKIFASQIGALMKQGKIWTDGDAEMGTGTVEQLGIGTSDEFGQSRRLPAIVAGFWHQYLWRSFLTGALSWS